MAEEQPEFGGSNIGKFNSEGKLILWVVNGVFYPKVLEQLIKEEQDVKSNHSTGDDNAHD